MPALRRLYPGQNVDVIAPCSRYDHVHLTAWRTVLQPGTVADLAHTVATTFGALPEGCPALSVSTSKGDPLAIDAALDGDHRRWPGSWPGDLNPVIARHLNLRQFIPCPVAAACSTGLYGLLDAADQIEAKRAAWGLVLAAEGTLPDWLAAGFARLGVLALGKPDTAVAGPGHGSCGFIPVAGAGGVLLSTAAASTPGWQLVAGVRLGDAGHETHFAHPGTLQAALEALWEVTGAPDLIVPHATGTKAGDGYELSVLESGPWKTLPRWCLKPDIGHCLGASGLVELALALDRPEPLIWKISLGFGGHLAAVAIRRS